MAIVETEHDVVVEAGELELDELVEAIGSGGGQEFSIRVWAGIGNEMVEGDWTPVKRELLREEEFDSGSASPWRLRRGVDSCEEDDLPTEPARLREMKLRRRSRFLILGEFGGFFGEPEALFSALRVDSFGAVVSKDQRDASIGLISLGEVVLWKGVRDRSVKRERGRVDEREGWWEERRGGAKEDGGGEMG